MKPPTPFVGQIPIEIKSSPGKGHLLAFTLQRYSWSSTTIRRLPVEFLTAFSMNAGTMVFCALQQQGNNP